MMGWHLVPRGAAAWRASTYGQLVTAGRGLLALLTLLTVAHLWLTQAA